MNFILRIYVILINFLYKSSLLFFKDGEIIIFISRQSQKISEDFELLQKKLIGYKLITITILEDKTYMSKIKLLWLSIKTSILLVKCKVCVLDCYWPSISVLKEKKFKVIQIWHSIGKIKQSGYQTLGKTSGRSKLVADILCMHKNYDTVIAGSSFWNPYYCKSFGIDEKIIKNYGLPRIDSILKNQKEYKKVFEEEYLDLLKKPIILYAPTFRKGYDFDFTQLVDKIDLDRFNLIIKLHPNHQIKFDNSVIYTCDKISSRIAMSVAEYVITDYSSIALEAAIINKKTYYFIPDYKEYIKNNGLNIDISKLYPELCFQDANELMEKINREYPQELLKEYREKFLPISMGNSTDMIVKLIKKYY